MPTIYFFKFIIYKNILLKEVLMADFSENDDDICEMIVDDEFEW